MNKTILIIITTLLAVAAIGQPKSKEVAVLKEISGLSVIKTIYPNATSVEKINSVWFKIVDKDKALVGYTLSSKPFTADIKGYNDITPVIVILDKKQIIRKIAILSHYETEAYIKRLEKLTYFNNWNGQTIEKALEKKAGVDSYSGATISANALSKNIEIVLKQATQNKIIN